MSSNLLSHDDEPKAISSKAKELKLWASCHVTRSADLRIAVEAGFTDAAHTPGGVMDDELIELMVTRNVSMTTTAEKRVDPGKAPSFLPPWVSSAAEYTKVREQQYANILDNLKRFYLVGGVFQIGTDYMSVMGFEKTAVIPVWELENLLYIGMPLNQVIKSGKVNGAKARDINDAGLVSAGMKANLIGINRAPGSSFAELLHPPFVMNRGDIIKSV